MPPTTTSAQDIPAAAARGPLERGFTVLRALSMPGGHRQRPSDLVHATGLARATVDRLVSTLTRIGYLRAVGRDVEPAPQLMELGNAYLASSGIPGQLSPLAAELADELDESVSLAVPDGTAVRFVTQHTRRRAMSLAFRIGDAVPVERCAAGTVLAAGWQPQQYAAWRHRRQHDPYDLGFPLPARRVPVEIEAVERDFRQRVASTRTSGWASDHGLVEPGLIAVAAPVTDATGRTVCALSVVSHSSRHNLDSLAAVALPRLLDVAAQMSRTLTCPTTGQGSTDTPGEVDDPGLPEEPGASHLQSLVRGLSVMRALGARRGGRTLARTAEATGLPRATVRRALLGLRELGYVDHVERNGRRYQLLPRVLELCYAHLSSLDLPDIVRPHLEQLAAELGESASMAVLDGPDIRYIARVPVHRIVAVNITVGTRFPAYATSMGRVLLAGLPTGERATLLNRTEPRQLTAYTVTDRRVLARLVDEAAERGHALVEQELEEGLRSLAVPVRDASGRVVAALNVPTHAGGGPPEETRAAVLPALGRAQSRMERDLRAAGGTDGVRGPACLTTG